MVQKAKFVDSNSKPLGKYYEHAGKRNVIPSVHIQDMRGVSNSHHFEI